MAKKIENMEIVYVEPSSSRGHQMHLHVTFNEEGRDFMAQKGNHFVGDSRNLVHLISIPRAVYEGDPYQRNKYIAESMRAVKSDYEDALELSTIAVSANAEHNIVGFTLSCDTDKLLDEKSAECMEEAPPPPEPEEDPV